MQGSFRASDHLIAAFTYSLLNLDIGYIVSGNSGYQIGILAMGKIRMDNQQLDKTS